MIFNIAKLNFFLKIDTMKLHNKLYNIWRNMDISSIFDDWKWKL